MFRMQNVNYWCLNKEHLHNIYLHSFPLRSLGSDDAEVTAFGWLPCWTATLVLSLTFDISQKLLSCLFVCFFRQSLFGSIKLLSLPLLPQVTQVWGINVLLMHPICFCIKKIEISILCFHFTVTLTAFDLCPFFVYSECFSCILYSKLSL